EGAEALGEDVATDTFQDDVGSASVGGREDLVRPVVILAVVDGDVGTERARKREFVVGAGGGDNRSGAEQLVHLDGDRADPAGGGVDQLEKSSEQKLPES
ncbi:MAG: hypothetical protein QOC69_3611, partial [Mycobacterium sp.]|nr:hypothetical protein [Mycobacterium sp.]